jgi:hypothetical protein
MECGGPTPLWIVFLVVVCTAKKETIQSGVGPPHSIHPKKRPDATLQDGDNSPRGQ